MRVGRVAALVVGYFAYAFALGMPVRVALVGLDIEKTLVASSIVLGVVFGLFGAWRDSTRLAEFLLGSIIYIGLATLLLFVFAAAISLRPVPLSLAFILAALPLVQCVCVGIGYLIVAAWRRRDRCPLGLFA